MNIRQALKMAVKSILGKKGRSVLTMLGIIIGIASVMVIVSVINGQNEQTLKQFEAMGTNKITVSCWLYNGKDAFEDLYGYCQQLSEYVEGVTPNAQMWNNVNVVYGAKSSEAMQKNEQNFWSSDGGDSGTLELPPTLYLGSDQYSICNNYQLEKGRDISYLDVKNYNQVCVLGAKAARNFFGYAEPVGKTMSVNGYPFTVIGVYIEKDPTSTWGSQDNVIVFPYTVRRIISPDTTIEEFSVKAKSGDAAVEATSRISAYLEGLTGNGERGYGYAQNNNEWQRSSTEWATQMSLVLGGIAAISLLVGGIGIMNIMLVTVTERTREIGIRRAIGAQRSSVVTQFLIEAAMLCGVGGIIGIAIGAVGTRLAGRLLVQMDIWPSPTITLGAFGFSVFLGVLFGLYPALKASKLQPVEALRAE